MPKFLLDNLNWIFDGIGVALVGWIILLFYRRVTLWNDGNSVYKWLEVNTQDEPHKSHKTLLEISNGVRLSEERVVRACLQNRKILQSVKKPGNYSIWRAEPQNISRIL
jgi:hypothetical protein